MSNLHKSSAHVQMQAEKVLFDKVEDLLNVNLEKNKKIFLADNAFTYIQPDFYSEKAQVIGEIFAHIGKPKKAQDNKIANDILKMLLLEKKTNKQYRKIIVVCDEEEQKKLKGLSALAESIRQFDVEIMYIELDDNTRKQIIEAQKLQRMTNA
ncbi:MAG: hypothetical protein IKW30_02825 [Lachnospiraceae bacterium]|nr:hypothetical protein [Lachnospiraceae bacterium]